MSSSNIKHGVKLSNYQKKNDYERKFSYYY